LESEDKYRKIFDISPELIVVLDKYGTVLDINGQLKYLTGYNPEEIIGENMATLPFIKNELKDIFNPIFYSEMSGNTITTYEIHLYHKNGDIKTVNISGSLIKDRYSNTDILLLMINDITENIKTQEQIKKQNFLLESITNSTPVTIYILDVKSRDIIWSNRNIYELFGIPNNDITMLFDLIMQNFVYHEDLEKLTKVLNDSVNKSSDNEIEYRIMDKQGNQQWLYSKFVPFRFDDNYETIELLGITYNIDERKALEASIRSSENSLRELNMTKDKFFSIISHDLKNPISTFLGLSDVLYSNYDDLSEKEKRTFSKVINDSAKKLFQLIENLLQWSRIQTGRIECSPENNNIYDIVENIIGLFELQINSKQLIVVNELNKSQEAFCDMNMINTVFRNIISNSIKFSENDKKIIISSVIKGNDIIISVQDFGTGIDEQTLANIFKIDKIQSKSGTDGESGTGIGLIICREFIELHQGKIWVDSKEGFGTTFYFSLSLKNE